MTQTNAIRDLLEQARIAHQAATVALVKARELAAAAGIPLADDEVITAQRINIVEPDGTLRLVISSRSRFPGVIIRGEEKPHPNRDDVAGLLFFNEEGTEDGGLLWNGRRSNGEHHSAVHLSFDNYEQDQTLVVESTDDGAEQQTQVLEFIDRPGWSYADLLSLPDEEQEDFVTAQGLPTRRMRLAREADTSVGLTLRDNDGRPRIVMQVGSDGAPTIEIRAADGRIVHRIADDREPGQPG